MLGLLAFLLAVSGWTWRLDRVIYDLGLATWTRPVPEGITVIAIDDRSIDAIGRWPWSRAVHATLLHRLAEARPRAVALDLVLSEPDPDPRRDELLAQALRVAAPVVLPVAWQQRPGEPLRPLRPTPQLDVAMAGAAEAVADADGVVRHAFLYAGPAQSPLPHLSLALLAAGGEAVHPDVHVDQGSPAEPHATAWHRQGRFPIRYGGPPGHVEHLSYVDVLKGEVPAARLQGRYLLVGMTAQGLGDTLATPVNAQARAMPGVEVLAQTLHTLRSGDAVREATPRLAGAIAAACVIALVALLGWAGTRAALAAALLSVPVVAAASFILLRQGLWWSPVPYAAAALLAYPLWNWRRLEALVKELDLEITALADTAPSSMVPLGSEDEVQARSGDRLGRRMQNLHRAAETVRSASRFLADVLASLPTAMLVADRRGQVLLANALAAALFEVEHAQDLVGLDLGALLAEFETPQALDWRARLAAADDEDSDLAVEAMMAGQGDHVIRLTSVSLLGELRWIVGIADVAPIRQAQRQREEALAFVSHDLRSPANSIVLLADLHLRRRMDLPRDELLCEMRRLAQSTLVMSEEFVRTSQAQDRPLELVALDLGALAGEVAQEIRPQALDAGVLVDVDGAPRVSLLGDAALLRRAFTNLLTNAIQHSPRGERVTVRVQATAQGGWIRVRDRGPGLSDEQLGRLAQGEVGLASLRASGVGFGLMFVQRVALRHRGRLSAWRAEAGPGAEFELQIGALSQPRAAAVGPDRTGRAASGNP